MMGDNRGESDDSRFWGPFPESGSSAAPSPLLAAEAHRPPLGAGIAAAACRKRRRRRQGPRAPGRRARSSFDRAHSASRWVAGADEAGRGCLAGPLVAPPSCSTSSASASARCARSARSTTPSSTTPRRARSCIPIVLRTAVKVDVVSRCVRGHRRPRPAQARTSPPCATRCSASPGPARCASSTASRSPTSATSSARSSTATRRARRSPRRRSSPRSRATATCTAPTRVHPGWEFAAHVGYSTPEHRDAIQRLGVSPLHRLSLPEHGLPAARALSVRRHQNAASSQGRPRDHGGQGALHHLPHDW